MIKTRWIRRQWIETHLHKFISSIPDIDKKRVLEVGSGQKWRYIPHSTTINRDADAKPDLIGDAEAMNMANDQYDIVLCLEVIEHTKHPDKIIAEIHRVLRPGGQVMLTAPFCLEIHDPNNDYHRFPRQGLKLLFHEFNSVMIQDHGGLFSVLAHFMGQSSLGRLLYPLYNNFAWYFDARLPAARAQRATLGYTVVARK